MTVIAWDGKTLAADKRATVSNYAATCTKLARGRNGELIAFAGDFDTGQALVQWYVNGANPERFPDNRNGDYFRARLIVILPDKTIGLYEREPVMIKYEDRFIAFGSGRDYALAAMHLGKSAKDAVEVACALDVTCGNGIDVLEHE